jgi:hypothetical protein
MIAIQARTLTQAAETLKSRNAPTTAGVLSPTESAAALKAEDKKAEEQPYSTKVSLSDFGKRQLQAIQMLKASSSVSDARKASARMRAAQLKQQLEGMKKMAAMIGPATAKGILRQIKQIARELRQIAAELGEPTPAIATGGGSQINVASDSADGDADVSDATESAEISGDSEDSEASEVSVEDEEAAAQEEVETEETEETEQAALAGAAEQAVTEAEKEVKDQENQESEQNKGVNGNNDITGERRARGAQRKEDAKLVRDLVKDLRFLLGLVKSALLRKDKEDKANLKDIDKQLRETERLAKNMEALADKDINGENIDFGNIASTALSAVETSTVELSAVDTMVPAVNVSVASISVYA